MNFAEKILARVADIEQKKIADAIASEARVTEIQAAIAEQKQLQDAAVNECDTEAFRAAQAELDALAIELEMYSRKKDNAVVSESESEAVIAELLQYEKQLDNNFRKTAGDILRQLRRELHSYSLNIQQTENAIRAWTSKVRPNYINPYTTYSDGSHKSKTPVTIHPRGYFGVPESGLIDAFIKTPLLMEFVNSEQSQDDSNGGE